MGALQKPWGHTFYICNFLYASAFLINKLPTICFNILWINFTECSPSGFLCGKLYAGLKKKKSMTAPQVAKVTNESFTWAIILPSPKAAKFCQPACWDLWSESLMIALWIFETSLQYKRALARVHQGLSRGLGGLVMTLAKMLLVLSFIK